MKQFFETLKTHIEQYPPNYGDGESVLSMLYECHNENNPYDNEQIKEDFNELYPSRMVVKYPALGIWGSPRFMMYTIAVSSSPLSILTLISSCRYKVGYPSYLSSDCSSLGWISHTATGTLAFSSGTIVATPLKSN